jgi:hypothetical protein
LRRTVETSEAIAYSEAQRAITAINTCAGQEDQAAKHHYDRKLHRPC